jgi:hypothetical protein
MKNYAIYDTNTDNITLIEVLPSLKKALELLNEQTSAELRVFRAITETQIKSLCYSEAVAVETKFRSERQEVVQMISETKLTKHQRRYGK